MKVVLCLAVFTIAAGLVDGAGIVTGGFTDRATNDEDVQRVAEFAAKQLGNGLISVESARSQVVAGTNYELKINVSSGCLILTCDAVVWAKLDGSMELTSGECGV